MLNTYNNKTKNKQRFVKIAMLSASLLALSVCFNASFAQNTNNNAPKSDQEAPSLQAGVTMIDLNSDKLDYFQENNQMVATGSARLNIKEQNSQLEADKITYDQDKQIVIAEGNVKITKEGRVINGEYAKIDLNKESALINDPRTEISKINIKAKTAMSTPTV